MSHNTWVKSSKLISLTVSKNEISSSEKFGFIAPQILVAIAPVSGLIIEVIPKTPQEKAYIRDSVKLSITAPTISPVNGKLD